jgi:hypothetical protein
LRAPMSIMVTMPFTGSSEGTAAVSPANDWGKESTQDQRPSRAIKNINRFTYTS